MAIPPQPDGVRALARADGLARVAEARRRGLLRADLAHWEVAELFSACLPLALIDVAYGNDFDAFTALWLPVVGENASGWLPALYLAALASPSIATDDRAALVQSVLSHLGD